MPDAYFNGGNAAVSERWWKKEGDELTKQLFAIIGYLNERQNIRSTDLDRWLRLYDGANNSYMGNGPATVTQRSPSWFNRGPRYNVVKSIIDTAFNKIAQDKPRPFFLTQGGNWDLQKRAKKLSRFADGIAYQVDYMGKAQDIALDAMWAGTGIGKIYEEDSKIKFERIFPEELRIDELEGINGDPRQLFQIKYISRDVLIDQYPDREDDIQNSKIDRVEMQSFESIANMVAVVEAWHRPSGIDAGDGKHVICIDTGVPLFEEEWTRDAFPFVFYHWSKRLRGFWGHGLAELLTPIQVEINKVLQTMALSYHLHAVPHWLVARDSKIVKTHLNNEIGGMISYVGSKPELAVFESVPQDFIAYFADLMQRAYQLSGVSELSAQSKKPQGLDSGKALREFLDIQTDRFAVPELTYGNLCLDFTRQALDLARHIHERDGKFEVHTPGRKFLETIDWGEVSMSEDEYFLKLWPTNLLPESPEGKLQQVQELLQAGMLTPDQGMMLLTDIPDLERVSNIQNAPLEDLLATFDDMLEHGKYTPPEPYQIANPQDLQDAMRTARGIYLKSRLDKAPEDKLELLRRWMNEAVGMSSQIQGPGPAGTPPGPPAGGGPPPGPEAVPEPTPQSPLLPNVPTATA